MLCIEMLWFGLKFKLKTVFLVTEKISLNHESTIHVLYPAKKVSVRKKVTSSSSSFIILSSFIFDNLKK